MIVMKVLIAYSRRPPITEYLEMTFRRRGVEVMWIYAVGTTVVALYAVADRRITGPYYDLEKHRVTQKWKTCDPCVSKKCEYQKCMENISVDEVFDVIRQAVFESI